MNPTDLPTPVEDNIVSLFLARAAEKQQAPFLWERHDDQWQSLSWQEITERVFQCAAGLRQRGIGRGMRVAIISENRHEWVVADLAIMLIGAISVPLFTNQTSTDYGYLLEQSGARAAIVSDASLAHQVEPAAQAAPACLLLVVMSPGRIFRSFANLAVISWAQLLEEGTRAAPVTTEDAAAITPQDVACIIYNSGASEAPKGAMLTHRSMIANLRGIDDRFASLNLANEVALSILPLSHAYEHTVGLYYQIHIASQIYFVPRPEYLSTAMYEVQPTLMLGVPRLYEIMKDRLEAVFRQQGPLAKWLFKRTIKQGAPQSQNLLMRTLSLPERLALTLLIRKPVHRRLGGRLKALISGGAALHYDVGAFFQALDITLLQGYGLTEASPVVSVNPPGKAKLSTVGTALRGIETKISGQGELCLKGDMIMAGYWDDPAATRNTIKRGWLHTGDLAEIDEDGYITILGVKRDMIVNSGGENISPLRVELVLTGLQEIDQAMISGESRPYITALLTPSATLRAHAKRKDNPEAWIEKKLADAVQTANAKLSSSERIRRFTVTDEPFSTRNQCLTADGEMRRKAIWDIYGKRINALYHRK